ncbi:hypothetical protein AB0D98_15475 [Streptomyces sp. NPDC047987]|uniref:hypothetical protein n=1 Tax=unclassified Streptomyces TaxID=2593676 RepID=UPI00341FFDDB
MIASETWVKLGAGVVVGGGIAAIPLPGSTAAALVVAPVAADKVGDMVNTFIGHEVDKSIDKSEQDATEKSQMTSQKFYQKGAEELGAIYTTYGEKNPKWENSEDSEWARDIESSYINTGSNQNDFRGRAPYKD